MIRNELLGSEVAIVVVYFHCHNFVFQHVFIISHNFLLLTWLITIFLAGERVLGEKMAESLKRIIAPYLLRRTKAEVKKLTKERKQAGQSSSTGPEYVCLLNSKRVFC